MNTKTAKAVKKGPMKPKAGGKVQASAAPNGGGTSGTHGNGSTG